MILGRFLKRMNDIERDVQSRIPSASPDCGLAATFNLDVIFCRLRQWRIPQLVFLSRAKKVEIRSLAERATWTTSVLRG